MTSTSKMLTTGQAARHCAVTPDTVLKWIRAGRLRARRTAGGHHRIDERELERVLGASPVVEEGAPIDAFARSRSFRYCWEFNGDGELLDSCEDCPVYQMRAQRCYEVVRLAPETEPPQQFCTSSCADCDYYRQVHEQEINVLVVSDDKRMTQALETDARSANLNLVVTECEYDCSAVINDFRPDYAVVDCRLGAMRSRDICNHLSQDPRIPFVRVVMAAKEGQFPTSCDKEVFARIQWPFSVK